MLPAPRKVANGGGLDDGGARMDLPALNGALSASRMLADPWCSRTLLRDVELGVQVDR